MSSDDNNNEVAWWSNLHKLHANEIYKVKLERKFLAW